MRNKILAVVGCCLLMLFGFGGAAVSAQSTAIATGEVQNLVGGIVEFKKAETGTDTIQKWIDKDLAPNAGMTSEWYIMALSQTGETYDFSAYERALKAYLDKNTSADATNRQKYALALVASGRANDDYVTAAVRETIGQQGIMSWIFGLHLINNGLVGSYTADAVVDEILSLRLSDGGWALYGENADIDVTAMAIQALAPFYAKNEAVRNAVDGALDLLAGKQQVDGGYSGFGAGNPESAAQVVTALSALGIDCTKDARFIKNGSTLIDGMLKYRLADGSFSHIEGGSYNHNATAQVFCALIAYQRLQKGQGSFFVFDTQTVSDGEQTDVSPLGYKFWVSLSAAGLALISCLILIFTKKTHIKNIMVVLLSAALVIAFVQLTDFSAASDYYNGKETVKGSIIGKVNMTIRCDTVVGKSNSEFIPADGVILPVTEFEIEDGDTVYDLLVEAARKFGIQVENDGTTDLAYISGINYLYEYQFGDLSGWVFHVNGTAVSVGCGEFALSDGDVIEWLYTCALGNDLT